MLLRGCRIIFAKKGKTKRDERDDNRKYRHHQDSVRVQRVSEIPGHAPDEMCYAHRYDQQNAEFIIDCPGKNTQDRIRGPEIEKHDGDKIRDHDIVDQCKPDEWACFPADDQGSISCQEKCHCIIENNANRWQSSDKTAISI